jgi:hypothetical protein
MPMKKAAWGEISLFCWVVHVVDESHLDQIWAKSGSKTCVLVQIWAKSGSKTCVLVLQRVVYKVNKGFHWVR